MSKIKIEKNIPIDYSFVYTKNIKYPYKDMEVGDSFVVKRIHVASALSGCKQWGERQDENWKFISRKIDNENSRIWRVE